MSDLDLILAVMSREIGRATAGEPPLRVLAMTSNASLVAGEMARAAGADVRISVGFTRHEGRPRPALGLGAAALGFDGTPVAPPSDTFVLLRRGWVGVFVSPAQLDAACRTNLSRVGGTDDAPAVALPGSRGLPENNTSPSHVWYLVPDHSARVLVQAVDFVSGPTPRPGPTRRLVTRLGMFDYSDGNWRARGLMPEVAPEDVVAATPFEVGDLDSAPRLAPTTPAELAAIDAVDPGRISHFDLGRPAAEMAPIIAEERRR